MRKIRKYTSLLGGLVIGLSLLFSFGGIAWAKEEASFSSNIQINPNASLTIKEKITYFTTTPHHGIYRYIPTKPEEKVKVISVKNENNQPYKYKVSNDGKNVTIRIGDPEITFTGKKTYLIEYKVSYPIHKVGDHLELYWDITGEGWKFPLLNVKATIHSPAPIIKYTCYSGEVGGNDKLCQVKKIDDHTLEVTYPQPITWNKNLTVAAAFPFNQGIKPPSTTFFLIQKLIFLFLLIFPSILFFFYWYFKGRDYLPDKTNKLKGLFQHLTTPITAYEPPADLTPGQVGLLIDEKVDPQDIVSEIIELARRGYLKIEKKEVKRFLFGHKNEYIFHKLKDIDDNLTNYQKTLLRGIFKGNKTKVKLSSLKGKFYNTFSKASDQIYKSTLHKYFTRNPKTDKTIGYTLLFSIIFYQFFLMDKAEKIFSFSLNSIVGWIILIILITIAVDFFLSRNLPQKTPIGMQHYLFIKGLKENLKRGAWRDSIKEKHLFIEEIIPYAIALGTIKQLAKDMKELDLQPPDYLNSFVAWNTLDSLTSDLNAFARATENSITYNPKSSGSGGSGFSGGFSGGGGGGGGGGSW